MNEPNRRSQRPPWLGEDGRGWDHVRMHVQLFQDQRIGANEIAIYGGIAVHAELTTGQARPSQETLATYTGLCSRTVGEACQTLEQTGYVAVKRQRGKPNVYRLLPPPALESTEPDSVQPPGDSTEPDSVLKPSSTESQTLKDGARLSTPLSQTQSNKRQTSEQDLFTAAGVLTPVPDFSPDSPAPSGRSRDRVVDPVWQAFADANDGVVGNRGAWAKSIKELKSLPGVTVSDIVRAIKKAERTWKRGNRNYQVTPHAVLRQWKRLHEPLPEGRTKEYALPDHESWMDGGEVDFAPPPKPQWVIERDRRLAGGE